ncbi:PLP-dependent cysteine synthase family protein [Microlunatus panaciterrae]|uniref:L-cysteine desulfhydrase Cds1 n=1 Tax=Microlunatus panaciterrae TaxID=400768 RepID=A0ABS2RKA4_9ACTN|nr:PLP-dependent cysteine synthase family protein [Microlunatus panaciterrae]MBM7799431.1 cysteine synthase A [Microlunatus panaciterrae]
MQADQPQRHPEPGDPVPRPPLQSRDWSAWAVARVEADANRSADTHLHVFPLPPEWGIELYLKDESVHPTGSLKHRLARSLVLYGLCNGWITADTTLVEASSGSTAVSEAYFARLLGLPFIAVMPAGTAREKCELIEYYGGVCHLVEDPATIYAVAAELADCRGGHYLDQFTYAERATDWRGNNNIAESMFAQLELEPHPVPDWVVVGAGTGGTSATIGRYLRLRKFPTRLCVVDPENSAFYRSWQSGDPAATGASSRIEGIGRPRVEPSFVPALVDRMISVPDAASVAAMRWCTELLRRSVGGSTGTNLWGGLQLVAELKAAGRQGSLVTLLCDSGARYAGTYYNDTWVAERFDLSPYTRVLDRFLATGEWTGVEVDSAELA